ncbi:MAG TPA: hypothetical protein DDW27_21970 [Bacteroidales bacterium]|nr:hypothetical protein [Bacteroidales bacterium]
MKYRMNTEKYTEREWEELASFLSEEKVTNTGIETDVDDDTSNQWKEIRKMSSESEIDVDKAWNKVLARINQSGEIKTGVRISFFRNNFIKIAAAALIILGLGLAGLYLTNKGILNKKFTVATDINQKNLEVTLPDGSKVILNRETLLSYRSDYGKSGRKVFLSGEAFFEVVTGKNDPFTIDAGKARIEVTGTSFNVITSNPDSAVEVFVKTGSVILSDNSGNNILVIDPGFIGTIDSKKSDKSLNHDLNYMAWNTGILLYDGQTLDVVFRDLKRVYNMDIVADDPAILEETWTSPINNQIQETIIRLICYSFNLGYTKDGNVYHLSKK